MKSKILGLVAAGLLAGPITAGANSMLLTATPLFSNFSSFTVAFNDTGDGQLQFGEVTAFSGVTYLLDTPSRFYSTLLGVPTITGISTCGPSSPCNTNDWRFGGWAGSPGTAVSPPKSQWSYSLSRVSVPEPGTLALLGLGLAGLGLSRRRLAA